MSAVLDHPAHVQVHGVRKTFVSARSRVLALEAIDMRVERGSFVAIVGASGCGKSTLLRMLAGLVGASAGDIRIGGESVRGPRRDVGMVFQSSILLPWRTILQNVLLPAEVLGLEPQASRDRALQLLDMVGLAAFADHYPKELSGGMQQRAAIARALLHDPEVLLMDEPFGALDGMTREQMNLELQRIWQESGKTIVLVTHSISEAVFLADRVVTMSPRPGRVRDVVDVPLPRPRTLDAMATPEFGRCAARIRATLAQTSQLE